MFRGIAISLSILLSISTMISNARNNRIIIDKREAKRILREEDPEFFTTAEATRIGDQLLIWQRATGGWPKNVDMESPMSRQQIDEVSAEKVRFDDSTTDNDATTLQLTYLARLYKATRETRFKDAFRKGVEYLLAGQYENGGWPQFWPEMHDYQIHITYNDDAMVNTMTLLRDIASGKSPYDSDICDESLRRRMSTAFDKGVECILATQIVVDDIPTVWCQQHDRETLAPAKARSYELPSYCSQESAAIVKLLMEIPDPDRRIVKAVDGAMKWFAENRVKCVSYKRVNSEGKWKVALEENPNDDTPVWARYYDLDNCLPFVCDRDGIPRRHLDEIGEERRNGYAWYNDRPASLFPLYDEWKNGARRHVALPAVFSGTMMPYDFRTVDSHPVWQDSLKPVYVAHVARHGARYISSPKKLEKLQEAIEKASAAGTLTKEGRRFKALLQSVENATGDKWGRLSKVGCSEEVLLAKDMHRLLPDLTKKARVNAISTYVPRVAMTMYEFCHELTALSSDINITASEGKQYSYLLRCFTTDSLYASYRDNGNWKGVSGRLIDSIVSPEPARKILGAETDLTDHELRKLTLEMYDVMQSLTAFGMPAPTDEFMSEADYRACWEVDNLEHYLRNTDTPLSSLAGKASCPLLARIIADAEASLGSRLIDRTMKDAYMNTTGIAEAYDANFYFGHAETLMPLLSLMRLPGCFDDTGDYATLSTRWKDYEIVPLGANINIILLESDKGNIYAAVRHNGRFVAPMEGNDRIIISWSDYKAYLIGLIMNQGHTRL